MHCVNYSKFAIDEDLPGTHELGNSLSTDVFLLKVNSSSTDFVNERFRIEFNVVRESRSYLRLKAVLRTTDTGLTPALDAYKIRLG